MTEVKETWILYQTTNLVNGKVYVGVHMLQNTAKSRNYLGSGDRITAAIKKYGRENFKRITLAEFNCVEDVYTAEAEIVTEEFAKRLDTYNISRGGRGGANITAEMKIKMRDAKLGKKLSEETKAKIGAASKGNTYSLGKVLSEETKAKMSEAGKHRKHSEETKKKISSTLTGKTHTAESKALMRTSKLGRSGAKNSCSVPIVINDKYYESMSLASKAEGIPRQTIRDRLVNIKPEWVDWRFATEDEKLDYAARKIFSIGEILDLTK